MTTKFPQGVSIPDEYVALPKNASLFDLKSQIETYARPEYETAEYVRTEIVATSSFKLRKNVGRFRGNDAKVYETVAKSLEKGYKQGKLPPVVLEQQNRQALENWLVNGNHRWMWYCNNGYAWMIVDVYRIKEGYEEGDVIDEVGLLHQPQPDGSSSVYDDYKARGISWVQRQKNKDITVSQEDVDEWVDKFAKNETGLTRANLKRNIFNNTEKSSFLTNYNRVQVVKFFKNCNINILDKNDQILTNVVDRLYEASQDVWIRDFLPTFLRDVAKGIKTRVNFYVNTVHVKDGSAIIKMVENRISQLEEIFDNLDAINGTGKILREYLIYGYRPPQIVDVDKVDTLMSIEKTPNVSVSNTDGLFAVRRLWQLSYNSIRKEIQPGIRFTYSEAKELVRPERMKISTFKNEDSFDGTLLREMQIMRDEGLVHFFNNGTYMIL